MSRETAVVIVLAILALALLGAWWGWRTRGRLYAHLPALPVPAGAPHSTFSVFYVATTEANQPLQRVNRPPLGFRGKAELGLYQDGVCIAIRGEVPGLIPVHAIRGVGVATWTIDKSVEPEGLVLLRWQWGHDEVDTYLRVVDHPRDAVIEQIQRLQVSTAQ